MYHLGYPIHFAALIYASYCIPPCIFSQHKWSSHLLEWPFKEMIDEKTNQEQFYKRTKALNLENWQSKSTFLQMNKSIKYQDLAIKILMCVLIAQYKIPQVQFYAYYLLWIYFLFLCYDHIISETTILRLQIHTKKFFFSNIFSYETFSTSFAFAHLQDKNIIM